MLYLVVVGLANFVANTHVDGTAYRRGKGKGKRNVVPTISWRRTEARRRGRPIGDTAANLLNIGGVHNGAVLANVVDNRRLDSRVADEPNDPKRE